MLSFSTYNPFSVAVVLFWYLLSIYSRANTYLKIERHGKTDYWGVFLILIFCLFPFQSQDYFHYMEALKEIRLGHRTHLEDFYIDLADFVNYNYFAFRLIVWGGAILFFHLAITKLNLPLQSTLSFLLCIFILRFSYGRVALAMACGIYGYAIIINSDPKNILKIALGVAVVYLSTLFHKSALFWFPVILLSLFELHKIRLAILLLIYPILVYYLQNYGITRLLAGGDDSNLMTTAQNYISSKEKNYGIGSGLRIILMRAPFYIFVMMFILSIVKGKYKQLSSIEKRILNISFYIVYVSTLFAFTFSMNTQVFYYRLLFFAILPISLSLTIFKARSLFRNGVFLMILVGCIASIYELIYAVYLAKSH